ncbi:hypothetical protein HID58_061353 [Brassica napus]|uniref:Uncharacterized protein n=2 Tax=Brassica napus TaxID=3708 RepID=A0ABQ7ZYE9_BRANA|nr:hypothetical protein HID58_061353 [Brassica napus]CDY53563.1 BnaC04g55750D [Brassica napus]
MFPPNDKNYVVNYQSKVDPASEDSILKYHRGIAEVVSMVVGGVNFLCDAAWCLVYALVVFPFKGGDGVLCRHIHGSLVLWCFGGVFFVKRHNVVGGFGLIYELQVSYAQLNVRSEDGR